MRFPGEEPFYYGARCERYENRGEAEVHLPNFFRRRDETVFAPEGDNLYGTLSFASYGLERGVIGIPRMLIFWELFPFFREFLRELGFRVILSPATNREILDLTLKEAPPTSCLPAKVSHGHVRFLLKEGVDILFVPAVVDLRHPNTHTKTNYNCPLVQAQPYILSGSIDFSAHGVEAIKDPLHFYRPELAERELLALGERLGGHKRKARRAIKAGQDAERETRRKLIALGHEAREVLAGSGTLGMVILGRLYNSCDPGLNLRVPEKLLGLGALPLPIDLLPWEEVNIDLLYPFMQWHAGKRILAAVELLRNDARLWPIYLTHFNCGPDSFLLHYVREGLRGKPFLALELDEHTADAGVITRLEAYLDSVRMSRRKAKPQTPPPQPRPKREFDREKIIYLPYMCDHNHALEGALAHFGYRAKTLPPPDEESLVLGRRYSTGGECLPFILTTGDFLKLLKRPDFDPKRSCIFMATSTGPCRFCHYFAAQRLVLKRLGHDVDFISLEAYDAYTIRDLGTPFRRAAWYGIAAVDLLQKLLWATRPYEVNPGETDAVYREGLVRVKEALAEEGIQGLLRALPGIVERFTAIEVREEDRPLIGVVGEIYVRANFFSNLNIVRVLEELGGEVRVAPVGEWLAYTIYKKLGDTRLRGEWLSHIKTRLERLVLRLDEHRLARLFSPALEPWELEEPPTEEVVSHSEPYISEAYRGEPVLTVGKAIDYALKGFDGIVNVMPFSCMPGTMVSAVSTRVRRDYGIPWINLTFDGQKQAHLRTRLEAFMHQAQAHRETRWKNHFQKPRQSGCNQIHRT
ncbi:acyl-CoA dehydratase activase-related protein [Candidatus Bipolaricaulota sp. J31]